LQFVETPKTPLLQNSAAAGSGTPIVPPGASSGAQPAAMGNAAAVPWLPLIEDAQKEIAAGDLKAAAKLLKEAFDKSAGHGVPRTLKEHVDAALSGASDKSLCRLAGLTRPRTYDLASTTSKPVNAGRPSITFGTRGPVMSWTDAHEGAEHAYTVNLDEKMRNVAPPIDVTPEGTSISRPELERAEDKLVMTYSDARGPEAGVKVRFLESDGRIGGPAVPVSASLKGNGTYPSLARASDGSFYIAWSNEAERDSADIFLRHFSANLDPLSEIARVTDFIPSGPSRPRARFSSIGISGSSLELAFKLERDPTRLIQLIRLPLADATKGLEPDKKSAAAKSDRTIGELSLVNTDKIKADTPMLACGGTSCFLVWHGETGGGAFAGFVDPTKTSQPNWRKKFSKQGGRPAVAVAASGQAQLVWFEKGAVLSASVTRDGRVSGDLSPPSIVAGSKPGEWFVAWLDYEAGHLEPYAARVLCK
jgi:hypothetical protein